MVNMKIKVIKGESGDNFEMVLNKFLQTIDVRQIIKIEHQYDDKSTYRAFVYYINEFSDLRDLKIDSILTK